MPNHPFPILKSHLESNLITFNPNNTNNNNKIDLVKIIYK